LIGLVSVIAPIIAGGNTCVVLASASKPLCAVTFAEVLGTSDVPGGTINILTGKPGELLSWFSDHMDVNAIVFCENDKEAILKIQQKATLNLKRVLLWNNYNWLLETAQNPYLINDAQEIKTTWHPIENIGGAKAGY
ncbi:MAG TPA: aldehyde dehydrogenase, partial [Chitinophagaceae bacterium]|nr:aldehyde dehydrogenase [Chitinophagaceae bacterium]